MQGCGLVQVHLLSNFAVTSLFYVSSLLFNLMKKTQLSTTLTHYNADGSELSELDRRLVERAKEITQTSYAVYSHFHVGAALLLENGETNALFSVESAHANGESSDIGYAQPFVIH